MDRIINLISATIFIYVLFLSNGRCNCETKLKETTTECEYFNSTRCKEVDNSTEECRTQKEICEKPESGKRNHCYVLWTDGDDDRSIVKLKGCFLNNVDCQDKTECVGRKKNPQNLKFCCCEGNMCNSEYSWEDVPMNTTVYAPKVPEEASTFSVPLIIVIILFLIIVIFTILIVVYVLYKRNKPLFNELPTMETHPVPQPSPYLDSRPIQLLEVKAHGRFGAVWRAQFKADEVAVKIFPIQDKQSWLQEQEIFQLPHMDHLNVLRFIGVEKRGTNLQSEFWLITAYHERGSLCDFLKAHTLSFNELCRVVETMARGLNHLHEALPAKGIGDVAKPSIAHRDFKSKNVLLKSDMTACIADFGLALVFYSGKPCGDTHGQVGTRRYMAPEVLEGAISFTSDAFLRIDMYACGLVIWELASRCTAQDRTVPEYRLPFEEEIGEHPTLEDMQEAVVQRKVRPTIPQLWRNHTGIAALCDTIEECWDHDAEARLSASCIMERVALQSRYQSNYISMKIENERPLSPVKENNI